MGEWEIGDLFWEGGLENGRMGIKRTEGWEGWIGLRINRRMGGWEDVLRIER